MMMQIRLMLSVGLAFLLFPAIASANSFTLCDVSGCRSGGSVTELSTYAKTRYPVVLVHGMGGFTAIGTNVSWSGIPQDLSANGANVFMTLLAAFQSNEVRGEQLLAQTRLIMAITGAEKVNLIGHSHGVQAARYVAGVAPQTVASVTSIAGANRGSAVSDVMNGLRELPVIGAIGSAITSSITNALFAFIDYQAGYAYRQDALAATADVSTEGMKIFNASFPAALPPAGEPCGQGADVVDGVRYYSWVGIGRMTNWLDPSDYLLAVTSLAFGSQDNDGLIGRCSSHLGLVIRDNYNMNHLDEINASNGLVSDSEVSPLAVHRQHLNRLKLAGL